MKDNETCFEIDGRKMDWAALIHEAQAEGYRPVPFCTVSTSAAAAFLRKNGHRVVEPPYVRSGEIERLRHHRRK